MDIFDFCDTSRVIEELAPEEASATSFNGWDFTSAPAVPYRRTFNVNLSGLKWYQNSAMMGLDETVDPKHNAGRLLSFYRRNRTWNKFILNHEYLGQLVCRFQTPVNIPKAIPSANGLIDTFEVKLIHHNPTFS